MPATMVAISGWRSVKPAVNHRPMWVSASTLVPSARTRAARSCHGPAGGKWAAVQHSANRSTRSGACAATHRATVPPSEMPASDAEPAPRWSRSASTPAPSCAIVSGVPPVGAGSPAWPGWA